MSNESIYSEPFGTVSHVGVPTMSQRRIAIVSLLLGLMFLGCSKSPPSPAATDSNFVGKIIPVQPGGLFDMAPSPFFHVRDADAVTGMLCLSSVHNADTTIWVHPSKFVSCMIVTEKDVKDFAAQQTENAKQVDTAEPAEQE